MTPNSGLENFLNLDNIPPHNIKQFVNILGEASKSVNHENLTVLLTIVSDGEGFLSCLTNFFRNMPKETSMQNYEQYPEIIRSISDVFRLILLRLPSRHEKIAEPFEALLVTLRALKRMKILTDEELFNSVFELEEIRDKIYSKERHVAKVDLKSEQEQARFDNEIHPPNDFREIPEYPEREELLPNYKPFLRPSIIVDSYNDLDHYLDVQYRLYREDFISPLREGLDEFMNFIDKPIRRGQNPRFQDIRAYKNVSILGPVSRSNGLNHMLEFDMSNLRRVQWEFSKRLIFGSLVCLSSDKFQTLIFATVANREVKNLKDGLIEVRFEGGAHAVSRLDQHLSYDMIETTAYFEACRHVLFGLQRINDIPFERYIVSCTNDVKHPAYLTEETKFDFSPMLNEDRPFDLAESSLEAAFKSLVLKKSEENISVPVLKPHLWPSKEKLKLDDSQLKAVTSALTREFAIIQGPPGTGKTYIGLKIVKTLLKNKRAWQGERRRPMLVVCYTNHALDQFMEGIHDFMPTGIVRAGSRSSCESLKKCMLSELRQQRRHDRVVRQDVFLSRMAMREDMQTLAKEMADLNKLIVGASSQLLNIEVLERQMNRVHYSQFCEFLWMGYKSKELMHMWLSDGGAIDLQETEEPRNEPGQDNMQHFDTTLNVQTEAEALQMQRLDEQNTDMIGPVVQFRSLDDVNSHGNGYKEKERDNEWTMITKKRKLSNKRIRQMLAERNSMPHWYANRVSDVWALNSRDRWRLYRYWLNKYTTELTAERTRREEKYERIARQLDEVMQQEDKEILQEATVIGMTTTGAAKYRTVLQQIQPSVIVVEEAAEVLEAHIITALSPGCQHLILIGDHKQLRPNPTVYRLAKTYNLEVSLFERMVKNGLRFDCLELQHRMRPEISILMKHIYDDLKDHESVKHFDSIKGVQKNIFLVNHQEEELQNEEIMSHSNEHEALFAMALCQYLLQQGYEASQITILTTYKGQLFRMKAIMKKNAKMFSAVRATVVDNFQGEENDIIILSLVRSNPENKIGFLSIENRVCVALSRARKGFYVIGNFTLLASQSRLWSKIVNDMQREKCFGTSLLLACQKHPQTTIEAATATDFAKAPEGGCLLPCGSRMPCGHVCGLPCHPYDPEHEMIK